MSAGMPIFAKLSINLDQPNNYKPGELITGHVGLYSEQSGGQELDVDSIVISFTGRSTSTRPIQRTSDHHKAIQLFYFRQELFHGRAKMRAPFGGRSSLKFPFNFMLPSHCIQSGSANVVGTAFFNSTPNQPLPPSFWDEQAGMTDNCSISYTLKAELLAPIANGYRMHGSLSKTLDVNVCAPRPVRTPSVSFLWEDKVCSVQTQDVLPRERYDLLAAKPHVSIKEKLGLRPMPTDCYRKAVFTASLRSPSVAVIGQPVHLQLSVEHNNERSTVVSPPRVHLRRLQVWLRTETSICALGPGNTPDSRSQAREQTSWKHDTQVFMKSFDKVYPRLERLDLRRVMNLELDGSLVPTFKTFNVARTYSLRVNVQMQCLGKGHAIYGNYTRITLLSADYTPGLPANVIPPPSVLIDGEDFEEPPPTYESIAADRPPSTITMEVASLFEVTSVTSPTLNTAIEADCVQERRRSEGSSEPNLIARPHPLHQELPAAIACGPSLEVRPTMNDMSSPLPTQEREDLSGPSLYIRFDRPMSIRSQEGEPNGPSLNVGGGHARSSSSESSALTRPRF